MEGGCEDCAVCIVKMGRENPQIIIRGLTKLAEECLIELNNGDPTTRELAHDKFSHVIELMNLLPYFPADTAEQFENRYEELAKQRGRK